MGRLHRALHEQVNAAVRRSGGRHLILHVHALQYKSIQTMRPHTISNDASFRIIIQNFSRHQNNAQVYARTYSEGARE
jgi:hypothetical protein